MDLSLFKKRVSFYGSAEDRIKQGKLDSLKKALYNSYQAETIILNNNSLEEVNQNRKFKCLINADKETLEFDEKMISIPFKDKNLITGKIEAVGLQPGSVFTWEENNTHWLVLTQYLEEDAYFRGQIQKCNQEIQIEGKNYWVCLKSLNKNNLKWNMKNSVVWNDLNNSLLLMIPKDDNTLSYFKRFKQIKIYNSLLKKDVTFKVEGYTELYNSNVLNVTLAEDFENSIKEEIEKENKQKEPITPDPEVPKTEPYIDGALSAIKYDTVTYTAKNFSKKGTWIVSYNGKQREIKDTSFKLELDIEYSKGSMVIEYRNDDFEKAQIVVALKSM